MDHLPSPVDHGNHARVHLYAPSSTHKQYYAQDFFDLPEEYGFDDFQALLEKGLSKALKKPEVNEFLQSWLWFSLLAQVLNTRVPRSDFHRKDDDTLSTKNLNRYITEWASREKLAAEKANKEHHLQSTNYVRSSIALDIARRFVSKHCAHDRMDRDRD